MADEAAAKVVDGDVGETDGLTAEPTVGESEFVGLSGAALAEQLVSTADNYQLQRDEHLSAGSEDAKWRSEMEKVAEALQGREATVMGVVDSRHNSMDHPTKDRISWWSRLGLPIPTTTITVKASAVEADSIGGRVRPTVGRVRIEFAIENPDPEGRSKEPTVDVRGYLSDRPEDGLVLIDLGDSPFAEKQPEPEIEAADDATSDSVEPDTGSPETLDDPVDAVRKCLEVLDVGWTDTDVARQAGIKLTAVLWGDYHEFPISAVEDQIEAVKNHLKRRTHVSLDSLGRAQLSVAHEILRASLVGNSIVLEDIPKIVDLVEGFHRSTQSSESPNTDDAIEGARKFIAKSVVAIVEGGYVDKNKAMAAYKDVASSRRYGKLAKQLHRMK